MQYEPIKKRLANFLKKYIFFRIVFYKILDLLLLRAWHIHKELKIWACGRKERHMHILDAGAGFGQYTYYMAKMSRNWSVLAVDNKKDFVCSCNSFFNRQHISRDKILFRTEDLVSFEQRETFNLILSVDVVEQISQDDEVLRNFHTSLKKEGMLLLTVPSDKGGSEVYKTGDRCFVAEQVRSGYSVEEMRKKLKKAGFKKIDIRYIYGDPGARSWRLSMKYPMLALDTSKYFFSILPFYYILIYPICFVLNLIDVYKEHKIGTSILVKAYK